MARKNQSPFEDLIDIISKSPWWAGVSLAPVFYLLLHFIAIREVPQSTGLNDLNTIVFGSLFRTLSYFGQFILPAACLFGAAISAFDQFIRRNLHGKVATSPGKEALSDMTWRQFEMLVGEFYRRQGYQVKELGGSGPDGGADLILKKDGEKLLVQCKQWKAYKVGVKPVRELLGVMVDAGAAGGIVVTSGEFTQPARNFARNSNIQLVNGSELHTMIRGAKKTDMHRNDTSSSPVCNNCGSSMVIRTARKGAHSGQQFWGCSKFPACRATLPLNNEVIV